MLESQMSFAVCDANTMCFLLFSMCKEAANVYNFWCSLVNLSSLKNLVFYAPQNGRL